MGSAISPRLPYLDLDEANPRVRRALETMPELGIFRMVANAQGSFVEWARLGGRCLDPALFDPRLREIAILQVAHLTPGAEYEWVQHVAIAKAVGATQEEIDAVASGELDPLAPDARLIAEFTTQVVRDAAPDDATLAAMRTRHTTEQIVQLLLVIGQYMTLGRIMATSQLDLDPSIGDAVLTSVEEARARRRDREQRPEQP